jgi:predicted nucleic acid-binding Zn ribbon protein
MPLHDVKCLKCDHINEVFWQPTEKPTKIKCELCGCADTSVLLGSPKIGFGGTKSEKNLEAQAAEMGW